MTDIQEAMQREAEREREDLERQILRYRGALRYYWDRLAEVTDKADTLSCALDRFTERHPEYAEEIKEIIEYSKELNEYMESPEDDEE